MKLDLKDRDWKEFSIEELFSVIIGKNIDGNKIEKESGKNAYITRKESNNGLDGFIDYSDKYLNLKYPVITIGNETSAPFVQNFPFFTGTKVNILIPHQNLSKDCLFFIAQALRMHKGKYSYSYTINSTRLKKQKILLPITRQNEIDFVFMENYVSQLEKIKLNNYSVHIQKRFEKIKDTPRPESLKDKEWNAFFIEEIGVITSGADIYEAERIKGENPYVTATANNNGIGYFVGNKNSTLDRNFLSVNRNGSVGYSFYHTYLALISNDCRRIKLHVDNRYIGLFISNQITIQKGKYGYGYKMGTGRLKRQKILLPVNIDKTPDYEYMTQYMQYLEFVKLRDYIASKI
ncbi:restriction endonuclease subunit S [Chryseobacterium sp.]|uniref:restriction endonuclease subunit S n=1 Tax=Chryseobacterium sp. TaxID=1871047 RepID=UPI00333FA90E